MTDKFDPNKYAKKSFNPTSFSGVSELLNKAEENTVPFEEKRTPQIQEEFSNPTIMPGFQNLPKKEQLERIAFSQFDPANRSPLGVSVGPGTFESKTQRAISSILPTLLAPEIKLGGGLLGEGASYLLNALSRIGTGTGANLAYELPEIKSKQDFKNALNQNLELNSILEGISQVPRIAGGALSLYKPGTRYASKKAELINKEYYDAKRLQEQAYKSVFEKHGKSEVTKNTDEFLKDIEYKKLYPEARKIYEDFKKSRNLKDLHDLQSQIGRDQIKAANAQKPKTSQYFKIYRKNLNDKLYNFLENTDKKALAQYKKGSNITRDLVKPYVSNKELEKISEGRKLEGNLTPEKIKSAITQGAEKKIYSVNGEQILSIPKTHPLMNHLNNINNRLGFANFLQNWIPGIVKKYGINLPENLVHMGNVLNKLEPIYYPSGRVGFGETVSEDLRKERKKGIR
jgi:hypothetical protein